MFQSLWTLLSIQMQQCCFWGCTAFWVICKLSCFFISHLSTAVLVYKTAKLHFYLVLFFFLFIVRLDDSLIELLDIFSPASNSERYRNSQSSWRSSVAPQSSQKTLLSPFGPSRSSLQDLEESEILEDIFFICWRVIMATQIDCRNNWIWMIINYSCALNSAF